MRRKQRAPERGRSLTRKNRTDGGEDIEADEEPHTALDMPDMEEESINTVADRMFQKLDRRVADFLDHVTSVRVHYADTFRPNIKVLQPVVKVHFLDAVTGQYITKSERERPVTTPNEGENVDFILPVQTKVYACPRFTNYSHIVFPNTRVLHPDGKKT